MTLSITETAALRNQLYRLDPDHHPQDRAFYTQMRLFYITSSEGKCAQAYDDGKGFTTVGVGFNMDLPESRDVWESLFSSAVSFDAVYHRKRLLSPGEIDALLHDALRRREVQLQEIYHGLWPHLRPNERLAIESAYYNAASLVNGATRFWGHIRTYIQEKDGNALKQAVYELKERSNREPPAVRQGIQNRRNSEAEMLSSPFINPSGLPHLLQGFEMTDSV